MARAGVFGAKTVADGLRALGVKVTAPQIRAARKAALSPMLLAAKLHLQHNGSVHRGKLLAGMVIADRGPNRSVVTASGDAVRIAHLVEFGTAPHWQPRRGVMHPGARPKPFLRPAFEETKGLVVETFGRAIQQGIADGLKRR